MVHVDCGVLNNMPADLIRKDGAGFVVAVDLSGQRTAAGQLNILELLTRVGCIGDEATAARRRKQCDVIISPNLANVGLANFGAWEQAMEAGYVSAVEELDQTGIAKRIPHRQYCLSIQILAPSPGEVRNNRNSIVSL